MHLEEAAAVEAAEAVEAAGTATSMIWVVVVLEASGAVENQWR